MPEYYDSMQLRMNKLFTEGFSVMDIVEPLPVVESCQMAGAAFAVVEKTRLPLIGVMEDGRITGYLRLEDNHRRLPRQQLAGSIDEEQVEESPASPAREKQERQRGLLHLLPPVIGQG